MTSKALSGIEFRANNIESFDNLEKNSVDFYASVRSLYLQDRENKIKNNQRGNIEVIYKEEEDSNLSNLITIPNNVLQGEFKKAGINTGRLVVNTTLGILGIFDVADKMGFPEYEKEDYGQTFGKWGMGPGCYLVLPVLGPTTIRDLSLIHI